MGTKQHTIISPSRHWEAVRRSPIIRFFPLLPIRLPPVSRQTDQSTASFAPAVPTPAPPADSSPTDPTAAWDAAKAQRVPKLYSWQQPNPSPSGPSVKWVEMRDPQDAPAPAPHNLPYTRYAYWAEDLDGYLDASQVGGQQHGPAAPIRRRLRCVPFSIPHRRLTLIRRQQPL